MKSVFLFSLLAAAAALSPSLSLAGSPIAASTAATLDLDRLPKIAPLAQTLDVNTGTYYKGIYDLSEPTEEEWEKGLGFPLVEVVEDGKYNELITTFPNLQAGTYYYRLAGLSKNKETVYPNCDTAYDALMRIVLGAQDAISWRTPQNNPSKKGEVRLSYSRPEAYQPYESPIFMPETCEDEKYQYRTQLRSFQLSPNPSTGWYKIEVKMPGTVSFRTDANLPSFNFELVYLGK